MTNELLLAAAAFMVTVAVQTAAVLTLVRFFRRRNRLGRLDSSLWFSTWALAGGMLILFVGHLIQIAVWAGLFQWLGEFEDFQVAFYHSAVNFSSLGYGDIVMSEGRRLLGALETACGVLMFGLSSGLGFAVINSILKQPSQEN